MHHMCLCSKFSSALAHIVCIFIAQSVMSRESWTFYLPAAHSQVDTELVS